MKKPLLICFIFFFAATAWSQVVTVTPALPNDKNSVEVIFDASLGSKGLAGYTGDVYAHTGVITNLSTGNSDWKYVKADWGVNIDACKLTSLGNNKWKLVIGPSIRDYYKVPAAETIRKLAFVFRSGVQVGGKWLEGKTDTGGDIFYDVFPSSISVKIINPADKFLFAAFNEDIPVKVSSTKADSTLLYIGNTKVVASTDSAINYTVHASEYGLKLVKAIAKGSAGMAVDSFYYYVRPTPEVAELPAGMHDGINYLSETSVLLSLYAPLKEFAFVIGDFNNWIPTDAGYMKKTADGKRFWIQIDGLTSGKEYVYQYLVDKVRVGDPYATKVSDPWNDSYISNETYPNLIKYPSGKTSGIATVLQTNQKPYQWKSSNFIPPKETDLVIYELLVRDFSSKQNFQSVIEKLPYLQNLGVNAIELMPVSEFEGNLSWGYNPNYYFAVDKYYGPADKLKQLIDTCHQLGIAVISDMVLNHAFGTSPYVMLYWDGANSRPAANSPFYNPVAKHDFNVGYDMNHESPDTKAYAGRILRYWLSEFHIDGFRFDLSKGFTQNNTLGNSGAMGNYDQSRINILSAYYDSVKKVNPNAYLILEHFADNSEEKVLAAKGMMLWGGKGVIDSYTAAAKANPATSDFGWAFYKARGFTAPKAITYLETHDEERQIVNLISQGNFVKDTVAALKRQALSATFFYTIPGPKMIWQFGEMGYDYSINYPSGNNSSRLDQKPPRWDYMNNPKRAALYTHVASLIKLHKENPVFETNDYDYSLSGSVKRIRLRNDSIRMMVFGNFDVTAGSMTAQFYTTGKWYELFTNDSINVTDVDMPLSLKGGEYRIYTNKKLNTPFAVDNRWAIIPAFDIVPNPVSGQAHLRIHGDVNAPCRVDIYDLRGKCIAHVYDGQFSDVLNLDWYPPCAGIFMARVTLGQNSVTRKIVVSGR